MTQRTYEACVVRLESLGAMKRAIQRQLDDVQAYEWSRDGRDAQTLRRNIQDIDVKIIEVNRQALAARARL